LSVCSIRAKQNSRAITLGQDEPAERTFGFLKTGTKIKEKNPKFMNFFIFSQGCKKVDRKQYSSSFIFHQLIHKKVPDNDILELFEED
jgi:hypothetical protein